MINKSRIALVCGVECRQKRSNALQLARRTDPDYKAKVNARSRERVQGFPRDPRPCAVCQVEFVPSYRRSRCCSEVCQRVHRMAMKTRAEVWARDPERQRQRYAALKVRYEKDPEYAKRQREQARRWRLRSSYGIEQDEYDAMAEEQGHVCAVCGLPENAPGGLRVDHDHVTRQVRGLLCANCNLGLGKLGDSVEAIRRALDYLERPRSR